VTSWPGVSSASPRIENRSSPVSPSEARVSLAGELQRQHAHADEVRAVDALEALDDHRAHAEQVGALGRPVAARAGAVFLAGDDHQRRAVGLVLIAAS
jgi:hypothetical protein